MVAVLGRCPVRRKEIQCHEGAYIMAVTIPVCIPVSDLVL